MSDCLFLRPYLGLGVGVLDNEGPKDLCQDKGWVPPPREERVGALSSPRFHWGMHSVEMQHLGFPQALGSKILGDGGGVGGILEVPGPRSLGY